MKIKEVMSKIKTIPFTDLHDFRFKEIPNTIKTIARPSSESSKSRLSRRKMGDTEIAAILTNPATSQRDQSLIASRNQLAPKKSTAVITVSKTQYKVDSTSMK